MRAVSLFSLASTALAASQGFNYGALKIDGSFMFQSDFQSEFSTAKSLAGTNDAFSSARLYTTIQAGTSNTPISAIPAAIAESTTLLLGLWASSGQGTISSEIAALNSAISQYGDKFTSLVVGISVGNEDLYRITPTGLANDPSSVGAGPDVLVSYIGQVRDAIKGTGLENTPVGHVDTWTAWVNGSNSAVAAACDFVGMNTFPYWQSTDSNGIENGKSLFQQAYDATAGAVGGKPVWVTETGWPVGGKTSGQALANAANAKTYWDDVGCSLFGSTNTWWYTLVDANTDPTQPEFGIVGTTLSSTPLYDLSCDAAGSSPSSSSSSSQVSTLGSIATPTPPTSPSPSPSPSPSSTGSTSSTAVSPSPASALVPSPSGTASSVPPGRATGAPATTSSSLSLSIKAATETSEQGASTTSSASASQTTSTNDESSTTSSTSAATTSESSKALVSPSIPLNTSVTTSYTTLNPSVTGSTSNGSGSSSTKAGSTSSSTSSSSSTPTQNIALALAPGSTIGLAGAVLAVIAAL